MAKLAKQRYGWSLRCVRGRKFLKHFAKLSGKTMAKASSGRWLAICHILASWNGKNQWLKSRSDRLRWCFSPEIAILPLLDSLYLPCWLSKYEPFNCPKYRSIVLGLIPWLIQMLRISLLAMNLSAGSSLRNTFWSASKGLGNIFDIISKVCRAPSR